MDSSAHGLNLLIHLKFRLALTRVRLLKKGMKGKRKKRRKKRRIIKRKRKRKKRKKKKRRRKTKKMKQIRSKIRSKIRRSMIKKTKHTSNYQKPSLMQSMS